MAKLRDSFFLPLEVAGGTLTLRSILRARSLVVNHALWLMVVLAAHALSPTRVAASVQRPLPSFQQEVVSAIGAEHQVRRSVVVANVIDVVNLLLSSEKPTEGAFGHEMMLEHISAPIRARMIGKMHQNVTVTIGPNSTLPVWVAFSGIASHRMADAKQHRLALTLNPSSSVVATSSNWSLSATTTSAESRRIRQAALQVRVQTAKITISTRRIDV